MQYEYIEEDYGIFNLTEKALSVKFEEGVDTMNIRLPNAKVSEFTLNVSPDSPEGIKYIGFIGYDNSVGETLEVETGGTYKIKANLNIQLTTTQLT